MTDKQQQTLVIEGNTLFEIDQECMRRKRKQENKKGRKTADDKQTEKAEDGIPEIGSVD